MKITISGWAGAGSSSLALLLAHTLGFELVQGGETFRYIYKNIGFETKGPDRNRAHEAVEPYFGPLFDLYVDNYLQSTHEKNIIFESDIASFRIGIQKDILSIFLKADKKIRATRTQGDGRGEDGDVMTEIDQVHRDIYKDLHGIDVLDTNEININHSLVMDNSEMSLADELVVIANHLPDYINNFDSSYIIENADKLDSEYWEKGKEFYKEELTKRKLIPNPSILLGNIRKALPEEFSKLPKELKEAIIKIS